MRVSELQPSLSHIRCAAARRLHNLIEYEYRTTERRYVRPTVVAGVLSVECPIKTSSCAADAQVPVHVQSQSRSSIRAPSTFPSAFSRAKSTLSLGKPMSTICLTASESTDGTVGTDDAEGAAGGGGASAEVEA